MPDLMILVLKIPPQTLHKTSLYCKFNKNRTEISRYIQQSFILATNKN